MMTMRLFPKTAALFATAMLATTLVGCDDSKPKVDPKAPQPPPSNEEVNTAKAAPTPPPSPEFDTTWLPGVSATEWTLTPGGSWYATVTPGQGTDSVDSGSGTVTVSLSMWTQDGTPVLLTPDASKDLVLPMGDDMFAGWNETIVGMRVGETRKIAIPWEQSLGHDGRGLVQCEDGSDDQQMLVGDVQLVAIDAVSEAPAMPLAQAGS